MWFKIIIIVDDEDNCKDRKPATNSRLPKGYTGDPGRDEGGLSR